MWRVSMKSGNHSQAAWASHLPNMSRSCKMIRERRSALYEKITSVSTGKKVKIYMKKIVHVLSMKAERERKKEREYRVYIYVCVHGVEKIQSERKEKRNQKFMLK